MARAEEKDILVVDDEPDVRHYLAAILEDAGFTVRMAADGEEALTLIRQQKPDFISLDLIMPKKSGHRLLYELRKDRELSRIPVLVVTAHARDELGRGSLQDLMDHTVMSGPGTYLEKPINPLSYVRSIQRALGLRESPETEDRISLKTELQKTLQGASAETLRKALEAVKGTAEPGAGKRPARREEDKS